MKIFAIGKNSNLHRITTRHLAKLGFDLSTSLDRGKNLTSRFDLRYGNLLGNEKFDACIVWAGVTDIQQCEINPIETRKINVISTIELLKQLNQLKIHTLFPSTNLVFSSNKAFPETNDDVQPRNEYARQKREVELAIRDLKLKYVEVLRISKVWDWRARFMLRWEEERLKKIPISVSTNRLLSPVKPEFLANSIAQILLEGPKFRVYHCGASFELSYSEFATQIYKILGMHDLNFTNVVELQDGEEKMIHNSLMSSFENSTTKKEFWDSISVDIDLQKRYSE